MAPDAPLIMNGWCNSLLCALSSLTVFDASELLKLTNEIDMDTLVDAMETLVELFSEQLTPFAVELCTSLVSKEIGRSDSSARRSKTFRCLGSGTRSCASWKL
jgi:hypothetical protein